LKIEFRLLNCLLLIVPLLVWNIVLGPRITDPRITSDAHSPGWLLTCENILRIFVFALPLLFPLQQRHQARSVGCSSSHAGLLPHLIPMLAPDSAWSNSAVDCGSAADTFHELLGIACSVRLGSAHLDGIHLLPTWHGIQTCNEKPQQLLDFFS
jgi:hypothetical protein